MTSGIAAGYVLAGKYRLSSCIGRGGMGEVWRGLHLTLNAEVAVKFIHTELSGTAEIATRFVREAQAAAALRSPHVVQILDYGVDGALAYMVMELLQGESLAARMHRQRVTPAELARIMTHVARALGRAHEAGIVHRDLKPDNVFLTHADDELIAKVLDFGIAKFHTAPAVAGASTRTGAVLGTPYYMSPEQAEGNREVDFRSDIWAMGVIAFECLVGRRPFDSDALGNLLLKICTHPIPVPSSISEVPDGFDQWFAKAVERDPNRRFNTAKEAAEALNRVCKVTSDVTAEPAQVDAHVQSGALASTNQALATTLQASPKRSRVPRLAFALVGLGAVIALVYYSRERLLAQDATALDPKAAEQPLSDPVPIPPTSIQPETKPPAGAAQPTSGAQPEPVQSAAKVQPKPTVQSKSPVQLNPKGQPKPTVQPKPSIQPKSTPSKPSVQPKPPTAIDSPEDVL